MDGTNGDNPGAGVDATDATEQPQTDPAAERPVTDTDIADADRATVTGDGIGQPLPPVGGLTEQPAASDAKPDAEGLMPGPGDEGCVRGPSAEEKRGSLLDTVDDRPPVGRFHCRAPESGRTGTCHYHRFLLDMTVELTTDGQPTAVRYICGRCRAVWTWAGTPVPSWTQVDGPGWKDGAPV